MNDMENMDDVTEAITIAIYVTDFLLNTGRILKAFELCKEYLVLLNNKALEKEHEFRRGVYKFAYIQMLYGCTLITESDDASAIQCSEKLLVLLGEFDEIDKEGKISFKLAELYQHHGRFKDATGLYVKALNITIASDNRQAEGECCERLGEVSSSVGDYSKAEEYFRKPSTSERILEIQAERQHATGILDLCFNRSVNMPRLKNIMKGHFT